MDRVGVPVTLPLECPVPSEHMLIDDVHQRAVQIEKKCSTADVIHRFSPLLHQPVTRCERPGDRAMVVGGGKPRLSCHASCEPGVSFPSPQQKVLSHVAFHG